MDITKYFRRSLPSGDAYAARFAREMLLIEQFKFQETFIQVRQILDLVPDYRWITRGSAGCSLIGYLMGIHNLDPVKNNFALSRFMHESRPDLPDIDVDFSYSQRDYVIEKVMSKYPNKVGRISNYVTYQEASAFRQALRELGFNKFIPKNFDLSKIAGSRMNMILARANELIGQIKNYSLHCGGIVVFKYGIPEDLVLKGNQIKLNKDDVEKQGYFKIDLLCNRGIAQLNELSSRPIEDYPECDEKTANLFKTGDTWGLTFGESPAQRRLHRDIMPKNRADIIFSLALIRPLPSADGRRLKVLEQFNKERNHRGQLIYDDDGIFFIQKLLNCSESEAEVYRKGFGKKKQELIDEFATKIKYHPNRAEILKELGYFSLYSFCHAHATSYGNLVWALAYEKARQPKKFWWSALNHAQSMYRPWVHVQEAKKAGLKFMAFGKGPWKLIGDELHPEMKEDVGDGWYQYKKRGYWISNRFMPGMFHKNDNGTIYFKGLIATGRHHTVAGREITFVTIGTNTGVYKDLMIDGLQPFDKYDIIEGRGYERNNSITVEFFKFESIQKDPAQLMIAY